MFDVTFGQSKCLDFGQFSCFRFGRNQLTERDKCRIYAGNTWIAITWLIWFVRCDGNGRPWGHIPMCSVSFAGIGLLTHNRFLHFVIEWVGCDRWIGSDHSTALTVIHIRVHFRVQQPENETLRNINSLFRVPQKDVRFVGLNGCNWHRVDHSTICFRDFSPKTSDSIARLIRRYIYVMRMLIVTKNCMEKILRWSGFLCDLLNYASYCVDDDCRPSAARIWIVSTAFGKVIITLISVTTECAMERRTQGNNIRRRRRDGEGDDRTNG